MDSEILNSNPAAKIDEITHYDDTDGKTYVEQVQDVTEIVEHNKALLNGLDERMPWGQGRRVASIPLVVYEQLRKDGIIGDQKKFRAWLNNPDNRFFRTSPGVV